MSNSLPKFPTLYVSTAGVPFIQYPDGSVEYLTMNGEWQESTFTGKTTSLEKSVYGTMLEKIGAIK